MVSNLNLDNDECIHFSLGVYAWQIIDTLNWLCNEYIMPMSILFTTYTITYPVSRIPYSTSILSVFSNEFFYIIII